MATENDIAASLNRFIHAEVDRRIKESMPECWRTAFISVQKRIADLIEENEKIKKDNHNLRFQREEMLKILYDKKEEKVQSSQNVESQDGEERQAPTGRPPAFMGQLNSKTVRA